MTTRKATLEDAPIIAKIHVATWQCAYRGQMPQDHLDKLSVEKRTQKWKKILSDQSSNVFVVEDEGVIKGFCGGGASRDADAQENEGEIYSLYVDQNYMGQGVGSALMKTVENLLRRLGFVTAIVWVLETNVSARGFYESRGYMDDNKQKTDDSVGFAMKEVRYRKNFV